MDLKQAGHGEKAAVGSRGSARADARGGEELQCRVEMVVGGGALVVSGQEVAGAPHILATLTLGEGSGDGAEWIRDGLALGGAVATVGGRLHGLILVGGTGMGLRWPWGERGGRGGWESGWGIVCVW